MKHNFHVDVELNGNRLLNAAGVTTSTGAPVIMHEDAAINKFMVANGRLVDATVAGANLNAGHAYFEQCVARASATLTGLMFRITRSGSVTSGWVGLFDLTGVKLAAGQANNDLLGSGGWKTAPFSASYTITAGTRYILGIVAQGDNIPGWLGYNGFGDLNQNIAAMPLRSFRKTGVTTLNANQDFSVNTVAHTDNRPFLAAIGTV